MFILNPYIFGGIDPDAQAFITAANITNTTEQNAIKTLVSDLKSNGIWVKCKAIYPFIGGNATSHKFNLKDSRDLNAAFRLQFNGGGTHSSVGYAGNGSTAWANTFLNASTNLTKAMHVCVYTRTTAIVGDYSCEMQVDGAYNPTNYITFRTNNKTAGNAYFSAGNDGVGATVSNTTTKGMFIGNQTSNSLRKLWANNSVLATNSTTDNNTLPNQNITLLGATSSSYSGNNLAFASIGDSFTDAEIASYTTIVQAYQTTLSRQV